jgi:hypothetical protein
MADAEAALKEAFQEHLHRLLSRHERLLDNVDHAEAGDLGRRAAEAALAPLIWAEAVGERWDTTEAAEFLGVTRQALHDRVKRGTLLGIPGQGVTWFPTWQFDFAGRQVRPVVGPLLQVFRGMDKPLEAVEIAAWAQLPQAELDDVAPADWIAEDRPEEPVVTTARHSAARLAA